MNRHTWACPVSVSRNGWRAHDGNTEAPNRDGVDTGTAPTSVPKRNLRTCGGVQDRWHSERFVRDGGCIDLTQFLAPLSRSGVGDR